jgi:pimeloyl-ACP methyl ester carboxylesterase
VRCDRRVAVGVGLVLVQLAVVSQPGTAAASPTARLWWSSCQDGFDCATLYPPLDYDRPDGVAVAVAVIRLPATSARQRIGSLLFNPGGPGSSGVDFVRTIARLLPPELRTHFDIVGFDPRGVARSSPLRCFATLDEASSVRPAFPFPVTPAEEQRQADADRRLAAACVRRGGPILRHMSTADTARDMDLLRHALGDDKLTYVGRSYRSILGQTYANLFPQRVRALVVDGVLDPVAWASGYSDEGETTPLGVRTGGDVGAAETLDEFLRLCDAAGPGCAFAGRSQDRYATLARRLRHHPIVTTDPTRGDVTFSYNDLTATTLGVLAAPMIWPTGAAFLADVESQSATTGPGQAATAGPGPGLDAIRSRLGLPPAGREPYPNDLEAMPGVACPDTVNPRRLAAWQRSADTAERRHGYFGRIWTWKVSACLSWPDSAGRDSYPGPWNARTSAPVLVVGNYFDPVTRYQGAVTAARLLPNSRLLPYAGWGHTAFRTAGNRCIDDHIVTYLVNARVPPTGTVCQPDGSPFESPDPSCQQCPPAAPPAAAPPAAALLAAEMRRTVRDR